MEETDPDADSSNPGRSGAWVCELSSCGSQVHLPRGTWNLPGPRIKPVSPALAAMPSSHLNGEGPSTSPLFTSQQMGEKMVLSFMESGVGVDTVFSSPSVIHFSFLW
ncbi:unnamed protein product [Rangifer tarandus platyrhynchus]|uniref:Uncharacterized protein n=2 Tax=Rangifer tarandus platyrhynchus TaxID=3082113 RepID=A0ABN8YKR7_RANTA|nr:unnamed protein product [Rangifer tarandus platyrhynchus]